MNIPTKHRKPPSNAPFTWPALFVATALLAGCGGGGGGGGSNNNPDSPVVPTTPTNTAPPPPPTNTAPPPPPTNTVPPPPSSNTAPAASPGTVTTSENISTNGTLAVNDAEGDPLNYSIVANGSLGIAVITNPATGAYSYTPNQNENGTDSFAFKANDGKADSNIARVTVTIIPVNQPPVAAGNCNTTPQAVTFSGTLGATDPDADLLIYSLNADGSGGSGPVFTAKGGEVTIDKTTGDFTYKPDVTVGNKRGRDSFQYQVTDMDGLSDSATEVVIVNQTIMPLGDSITSGSGEATVESERRGYRFDLQKLLTNAGYSFDFVGSDTKGNAIPGFDFNNEGHGGWNAFQLANGGGQVDPGETDGDVFQWLDLNPADIVLLHAGTNALTPGGTNADDVAKDMISIIGRIREWESSANGNPVTVILATIIDQGPAFGGQDVQDFNLNLINLYDARKLAGENIHLVDQYGALAYPVDMFDNLHPSTVGYSRMASAWFNEALVNVIEKCP